MSKRSPSGRSGPKKDRTPYTPHNTEKYVFSCSNRRPGRRLVLEVEEEFMVVDTLFVMKQYIRSVRNILELKGVELTNRGSSGHSFIPVSPSEGKMFTLLAPDVSPLPVRFLCVELVFGLVSVVKSERWSHHGISVLPHSLPSRSDR